MIRAERRDSFELAKDICMYWNRLCQEELSAVHTERSGGRGQGASPPEDLEAREREPVSAVARTSARTWQNSVSLRFTSFGAFVQGNVKDSSKVRRKHPERRFGQSGQPQSSPPIKIAVYWYFGGEGAYIG